MSYSKAIAIHPANELLAEYRRSLFALLILAYPALVAMSLIIAYAIKNP